MTPYDHSTDLQRLLHEHLAGSVTARNELIQRSLQRCQHLAHRMFWRHRDLHAIEQTDDVLQKALLRLYLALTEVKPPNVRAFFALAARQIRWVLLDLIRKHPVNRRLTCVTDSAGSDERLAMPPAPEGEPADLMEWTCFHEVVEGLPEEERETFDLLFYEGLTQEQAAKVLDASVRTVKRRWQRARLLLRERLATQ